MSVKKFQREILKRKSADTCGFEKWLTDCQKESYEKYQQACVQITENSFSSWFDHSLKEKISPVLNQIGFDKSISRTLFKAAAPAWEKMGPMGDKLFWFDPKLNENLEEVRAGVLQKASDKSKRRLMNEEHSTESIREIAEQEANPANLLRLVDNIPTSWIILPRAYQTLENCNSTAMTSYVNCLVQENDPEFKKFLARIITELLGNFTLKFLGEKNEQEQVARVIFYGYAVMFWRNLTNPPVGFEESEIYRNFLGWAKLFINRNNKFMPQRTASLAKMVYAAQSIFPEPNAFNLCKEKDSKDMGRFLIALRHGQVGVDAVCSHFGVRGRLFQDTANSSAFYIKVPQKLSRFMRLVRKRFSHESPKTRQSIDDFMMRMKVEYGLLSSRLNNQGSSPVFGKLRFATRRVVGIIMQSEFAGAQQK